MRINGGFNPVCPLQMPDAVLSQANPVSGVLYPVLPLNYNVRIIGASASIFFALGAPDPLELVITIDGEVFTFTVNTPANSTPYNAYIAEFANNASQVLNPASFSSTRAFMLEGRSVSINSRITWAVDQPTPLNCRVKWAQW